MIADGALTSNSNLVMLDLHANHLTALDSRVLSSLSNMRMLYAVCLIVCPCSPRHWHRGFPPDQRSSPCTDLWGTLLPHILALTALASNLVSNHISSIAPDTFATTPQLEILCVLVC
jgi:hypothetical protein